MPEDNVIPLPDAQLAQEGDESTHARKARHLKASQKDGVRLVKRDGSIAYIEYGKPYALHYFPGKGDGQEQIECRMGESGFTAEGRDLLPLFEALQKRHCDTIRESDPDPADAAQGESCILRLTVRLWL